MAVERFILQLEKEELKPTISQDEIDDIEKGVNIFVKLLTDEVAKTEKLFTIKRILKVGSFYEKTKVGNPDEFDFLLELDGTFELEIECKHNPCSAHVKSGSPVCTDKTILSPRGYFPAEKTYALWRRKVADTLGKAIYKENNLGKIQCEMGHLTLISSLYGSGPNAEIGLVWNGARGEFTIGIDLSICIPCTDELLKMWQSEFIPLNASEMSRLVLIVPSQSRNKLNACRLSSKMDGGQLDSATACWKISTTPIEVARMRNIPEPYRICYIVLKWLFKRREVSGASTTTCSMSILSSYMIKNAVLFCRARDEKQEPVDCLEQVLQYLHDCTDKKFLPAYFTPSVNLWRFAGPVVKPPREVLELLKTFLFITLQESSAQSLSFRDARRKVFELQRQFTDFQIDALHISPEPILALEDGSID